MPLWYLYIQEQLRRTDTVSAKQTTSLIYLPGIGSISARAQPGTKNYVLAYLNILGCCKA